MQIHNDYQVSGSFMQKSPLGQPPQEEGLDGRVNAVFQRSMTSVVTCPQGDLASERVSQDYPSITLSRKPG